MYLLKFNLFSNISQHFVFVSLPRSRHQGRERDYVFVCCEVHLGMFSISKPSENQSCRTFGWLPRLLHESTVNSVSGLLYPLGNAPDEGNKTNYLGIFSRTQSQYSYYIIIIKRQIRLREEVLWHCIA